MTRRSLDSMPTAIDRGAARPPADVVCLAHLRWDDVYQRPHHLMTRAARRRRVFYVEEPRIGSRASVSVTRPAPNIHRIIPTLPDGLAPNTGAPILRALLGRVLAEHAVRRPVVWYYNPLALRFAADVDASAVVYDCMDELTAFARASSLLPQVERQLFAAADVVFAGGQSLYEAKRGRHPNIHAFPSSVELGHFRTARGPRTEPADQVAIPRPRLGFVGVVDERIDLALLDAIARARPGWQLVILGPVKKVEPEALPRGANVHYLGQKGYPELPDYLASWDVALLPFALNDATRHISPTKTLEYLAAGRPVVSTPIRDVVRPYGDAGLVRIAADAPSFITAVEAALAEDPRVLLPRVDAYLAGNSWDATWAQMERLVNDAVQERGVLAVAGRGGRAARGEPVAETHP